MTHQFNPDKTSAYFNGIHDEDCTMNIHRHNILLKIILPFCEKTLSDGMSAVDFGCGGGALLIELLRRGFDAYGIEKHDTAYDAARKRILDRGHPAKHIMKGGVEALHRFDSASIDILMIMGVLQYLPPEEYEALFGDVHRILRKGGYMVCSFQNALFDLYTFNKYTLDFYKTKLLNPLSVDRITGESIFDDLRCLIVHPEEPQYSPTRARDNIFVRTTNPLTIEEELKEKDFRLIEKYFYDFYLVPPLLQGKYEKQLQSKKQEFEVNRATEWFGYFMANAFVALCEKC